jgi:AAA+ superfamily predicted ATPase
MSWQLTTIAVTGLVLAVIAVGTALVFVLPEWRSRKRSAAKSPDRLIAAFFGCGLDELVTRTKTYPQRTRADLQVALDQLLQGFVIHRWNGVHVPHYLPTGMDLQGLLEPESHMPSRIGSPTYEDVDVGGEQPIRCLACACIWLAERNGQRFVLFVGPAERYGQSTGIRVEIAMAATADQALVDELYREFDRMVLGARCYRGKVLSLQRPEHCGAEASTIVVHRLERVDRDQLILPERTIDLVERNVMRFVELRDDLAAAGQNLHKGLLFHGPPGTGKTHCIRHVITSLSGHTTFLVTAEHVAMLDQYVHLARLLEPSLLVIEDVDLIARERSSLQPGQESLLNRLLNEMDGLNPDARLIFVLTTNNPDAIEPALAARPGRIDQAIHFPLPDEAARFRLVHLYAGEVSVPVALIEALVRRTAGASAAFIKELMRKATQSALMRTGSPGLEQVDLDEALEELLAGGDALAKRLLGAESMT